MPENSPRPAEHLRALVDRRLAELLPDRALAPQRLHEAMAYAVLAPGKRLRPLLTLMTAADFGAHELRALDAACAIEMVHAASLIMDDMPAMDDAALRRGQPTVHRAFGEDTAMLASVALLNQAYGVLSATDGFGDGDKVALVGMLSRAVGSEGLIGGQLLDLRERSPSMGETELQRLNHLKTAALFVAAVEAGARTANAGEHQLEPARTFALELGLAFQIADDMLDDPAFAGKTGKDTGKDAGKPTLVSVLGAQEAQRVLERHLDAARASLGQLGCRNGHLASFLEASFGQFGA